MNNVMDQPKKNAISKNVVVAATQTDPYFQTISLVNNVFKLFRKPASQGP